MTRSKGWSAEQVAVLVSAVRAGKTVRDIAEMTGRHPETVRSKAKSMGMLVTYIKPKPKAPEGRPTSPIVRAMPRPSSFTAWVMGDPDYARSALGQREAKNAQSRSALDQKRAGQ